MPDPTASPQRRKTDSQHAPLPRLTLQLLGRARITYDAAPLPSSVYDKARTLLIYLAMESGRLHLRDELAALLWPDAGGDAARLNLRQALHRLRQAIDTDPSQPAVLISKRDVVGFNPEISHWIDVHSFQNPSGGTIADLEASVQLYQGEFLAELTSAQFSTEFEDWLLAQREALHRQALARLEQLQQLYEQSGDLERAIQYARRYCELEPWDEAGHRHLMLLLANNGQIAAAQVQYRACQKMLAEELGVEPSEETDALLSKIIKMETAGHVTRRKPATKKPRRRRADKTPLEPSAVQRERRQVTALYCGIGLNGFDADELAEHIDPPRRALERLIADNAGFVVRSHLGGILAFFGYPVGLEDSARRALICAERMHELAAATDALDLRVHIGIHTAITVTGDELGQPDAVGLASAAAIRLRDCATAGGTCISAETRQLVEGYFHTQSVGELDSPGGETGHLHIFRILGASGATDRIAAIGIDRLAPLIGRQHELAQLLHLWQEAQRDAGRPVVLVRGEPGIGKSRLLHALEEDIRSNQGTIHLCRCQPEHKDTAFYPILPLLNELFGIHGNDTQLQRITRIETKLDSISLCKAAVLPLLADLFSLPLPSQWQHPSDHSTNTAKQRLHEAIVDLLQHHNSGRQLLYVVEDLHWADPSTLELLNVLLQRPLNSLRMVVLTARNDFDPRSLFHHVDLHIEVRPFRDDESLELVRLIAGNISLGTQSEQMIVRMSSGVPLFVEEMTRMSLRRGMLDQGSQQRLFSPAIPPTLHDLLLARIDHLGPHKPLVQLASTVGRSFDLELLNAVSNLDERSLLASLEHLVDEGILVCRLEYPEREPHYHFRHALIQEAAYQSQVKSVRRASHHRVARILLERFPETVAAHPEWLAWHLTAAEQHREAIDFWYRAGQLALQRLANTEAMHHFSRGLKLLDSLPRRTG